MEKCVESKDDKGEDESDDNKGKDKEVEKRVMKMMLVKPGDDYIVVDVYFLWKMRPFQEQEKVMIKEHQLIIERMEWKRKEKENESD